MIKLNNLEMGRLSWVFSVFLKFNHKDPYKREARRSKGEIGDMMRDERVGVIQGKGDQPGNAWSLQKLEVR